MSTSKSYLRMSITCQKYVHINQSMFANCYHLKDATQKQEQNLLQITRYVTND